MFHSPFVQSNNSGFASGSDVNQRSIPKLLETVDDVIECYRDAMESEEIVDFLPGFQFNHLPIPDGWGVNDLLRMAKNHHLACYCKLCEAHANGKPLNVKCADCKPCHVDVIGAIIYPDRGEG